MPRNPFHAIIDLSQQLKEFYSELSDTEKVDIISSIIISGNMAYKLDFVIRNLISNAIKFTNRVGFDLMR
ncbi:MAG: hypothetical protein FJY10_05715 [Bacteroidetes bacterium]|nr:hypothetical protein [Bacteroidota bacterium]